ncbi:hypothetical protein HK102_008460 [Quaeritorhiza haematococci]|nr:hypothetical protein HK102_008460 [Quaeritorhiza haematococci]
MESFKGQQTPPQELGTGKLPSSVVEVEPGSGTDHDTYRVVIAELTTENSLGQSRVRSLEATVVNLQERLDDAKSRNSELMDVIDCLYKDLNAQAVAFEALEGRKLKLERDLEEQREKARRAERLEAEVFDLQQFVLDIRNLKNIETTMAQEDALQNRHEHIMTLADLMHDVREIANEQVVASWDSQRTVNNLLTQLAASRRELRSALEEKDLLRHQVVLLETRLGMTNKNMLPAAPPEKRDSHNEDDTRALQHKLAETLSLVKGHVRKDYKGMEILLAALTEKDTFLSQVAKHMQAYCEVLMDMADTLRPEMLKPECIVPLLRVIEKAAASRTTDVADTVDNGLSVETASDTLANIMFEFLQERRRFSESLLQLRELFSSVPSQVPSSTTTATLPIAKVDGQLDSNLRQLERSWKTLVDQREYLKTLVQHLMRNTLKMRGQLKAKNATLKTLAATQHKTPKTAEGAFDSVNSGRGHEVELENLRRERDAALDQLNRVMKHPRVSPRGSNEDIPNGDEDDSDRHESAQARLKLVEEELRQLQEAHAMLQMEQVSSLESRDTDESLWRDETMRRLDIVAGQLERLQSVYAQSPEAPIRADETSSQGEGGERGSVERDEHVLLGIQKELQHIQQDYANLKMEHQEALSLKFKLEKERQELVEHHNETTLRLEFVTNQVERLRDDYMRTQQDATDLRNRCSAVEHERLQVLQEQQRLLADVQLKDAHLEVLKRLVSETQQKYDDLAKSVHSEANETPTTSQATQQSATLSAQLETALSDKEASTHSSKIREAELQELRRDLEVLSGKYAELEREKYEIASSNESLIKRLAASMQNAAVLEANVARLETEGIQMKAKVDASLARAIELQTSLDKIARENALYRSKLSEDSGDAQATVMQLVNRLGSAMENEQRLYHELVALQERMKDMHASFEEKLEVKQKELLAELDVQKGVNRGLHEQVKQLESRLVAFKSCFQEIEAIHEHYWKASVDLFKKTEAPSLSASVIARTMQVIAALETGTNQSPQSWSPQSMVGVGSDIIAKETTPSNDDRGAFGLRSTEIKSALSIGESKFDSFASPKHESRVVGVSATDVYVQCDLVAEGPDEVIATERCRSNIGVQCDLWFIPKKSNTPVKHTSMQTELRIVANSLSQTLPGVWQPQTAQDMVRTQQPPNAREASTQSGSQVGFSDKATQWRKRSSSSLALMLDSAQMTDALSFEQKASQISPIRQDFSSMTDDEGLTAEKVDIRILPVLHDFSSMTEERAFASQEKRSQISPVLENFAGMTEEVILQLDGKASQIDAVLKDFAGMTDEQSSMLFVAGPTSVSNRETVNKDERKQIPTEGVLDVVVPMVFEEEYTTTTTTTTTEMLIIADEKETGPFITNATSATETFLIDRRSEKVAQIELKEGSGVHAAVSSTTETVSDQMWGPEVVAAPVATTAKTQNDAAPPPSTKTASEPLSPSARPGFGINEEELQRNLDEIRQISQQSLVQTAQVVEELYGTSRWSRLMNLGNGTKSLTHATMPTASTSLTAEAPTSTQSAFLEHVSDVDEEIKRMKEATKRSLASTAKLLKRHYTSQGQRSEHQLNVERSLVASPVATSATTVAPVTTIEQGVKSSTGNAAADMEIAQMRKATQESLLQTARIIKEAYAGRTVSNLSEPSQQQQHKEPELPQEREPATVHTTVNVQPLPTPILTSALRSRRPGSSGSNMDGPKSASRQVTFQLPPTHKDTTTDEESLVGSVVDGPTTSGTTTSISTSGSMEDAGPKKRSLGAIETRSSAAKRTPSSSSSTKGTSSSRSKRPSSGSRRSSAAGEDVDRKMRDRDTSRSISTKTKDTDSLLPSSLLFSEPASASSSTAPSLSIHSPPRTRTPKSKTPSAADPASVATPIVSTTSQATTAEAGDIEVMKKLTRESLEETARTLRELFGENAPMGLPGFDD